MSALPHSTRLSPTGPSSGVLVLGDELHAGSIDGANAGNLPCSLRRFKRDDLKARLSAQVDNSVLGLDVKSDGLQRFASRQTVPHDVGNALILFFCQLVFERRHHCEFVDHGLDSLDLAGDLNDLGLLLLRWNGARESG